MSAEDIFDDAAEDIFDALGVSATYTPSVGDPILCMVKLLKNVDLEPQGYDTQIWGTMTTIEGILSVLGKEPDTDETFTIGSDTYTVQTVIENDGRFVKMAVK